MSAALGAAASSTGTASGTNQRRTLAEDKRMEVPQISGREAIHDLIEWYDRILIKMESCITGSRDVIVEIVELKTPISFGMIQSIPQKAIAHRLNAELYSGLYNVCTGNAWTFLKSVPQGAGLEGFRVVYQQVTRRTPQQMEQ